MLVLGDAHADVPARRKALLAAYDAADEDVAIQLGDIEHYDLPIPTHFIAGNNENFDVIDALRAGQHPDGVNNATLLASTVAEVEGVRVAGLSGNFAPTRYDKPRAALVGDRRRHFTHEDVERAAQLDDVDVFLCHEAPTGLVSYSYDAGCSHVDDLLEALEPALCLVGHHHRHVAGEKAGVPVVSLAPVWERYYTLDPTNLELTPHEAPVEAPSPD